MTGTLKEVQLPEPEQHQWQIVLADSRGFPKVVGAYLLANGGKRLVKIKDLPERIRAFWCLERDEDDISVWRSTGLDTLAQIKKAIGKKENYDPGLTGVCIVTETGKPPTLMCVEMGCKEPLETPDTVYQLLYKHGCDGSHCGLGDWYPPLETAIKDVLRKGSTYSWSTGWYSSKKEIASARVSCVNKQILAEASVSDDFDTEGTGECRIEFTRDLETIRQAIYKAWNRANEAQKDNRVYCGFSVLHYKRFYYGTAKKVHRHWGWVETYIAPVGLAETWDSPPGDNYSKWGFQGEQRLPVTIRRRFRRFVERYLCGSGEKQLTVGTWRIEPWKDEDAT